MRNPGRLTPTWFAGSHTSLTHIPVQVKGAGGRQSPLAPGASVSLSLCLLLSPVPQGRRVMALLRGLQEGRLCFSHHHAVFVCSSCHNKYHGRWGGLNDRRFFSSSSSGEKSKIKASAGRVPSEASLLGLWTAAFSLYLHMGLPLTCLYPVTPVIWGKAHP